MSSFLGAYGIRNALNKFFHEARHSELNFYFLAWKFAVLNSSKYSIIVQLFKSQSLNLATYFSKIVWKLFCSISEKPSGYSAVW